MQNRLILVIVTLLLPLSAFAQDEPFMYNATPKPNRCADGRSCKARVYPDGSLVLGGSDSASLTEAVPAPMVVFLATAVPTTVPTPQFVNTTAMKHSFVDNSTNQEVYVHLNGSITPIARVPAGSVWFRNWGATGSKMSGSIAVTRPGTLPTTGSIAIGGDS